MQCAMKSLKKANDKRATEARLQQVDLVRRQEAQAQAETEAAKMELNKLLKLKRNMTCFAINWQEAGHTAVAVLKSDDDVKSKMSTAFFETPFILEGSTMLKEIMDKKDGPKEWLDKWHTEFPKSKMAIESLPDLVCNFMFAVLV
jgi:hypothetical protein